MSRREVSARTPSTSAALLLSAIRRTRMRFGRLTEPIRLLRDHIATAMIEAIHVVAGSVWLVGMAERRVNRIDPRAHGWARSAFAAFVIQGPVLMALASATRPFDCLPRSRLHSWPPRLSWCASGSAGTSLR